MVKDIRDLVEDIYEVVQGLGGWDEACTKFLSDGIAGVVAERMGPQVPRTNIGFSSVGTPCTRKLWYRVNKVGDGSSLSAQTLGTFLYGDILEVLVLALAQAAGHEVVGMQDTMEIAGVKGHRDAVIDGMTVDVKSASSFSFQKFQQNKLRDNDPFGYISQLSSYVYAGKDDPLVTDKKQGAFLVINKDRFLIHLDIHDFTKELEEKEEEFEAVKKAVAGPMPERTFKDKEDGYTKGRGQSKVFVKNGNKVLGTQCSYCEYKKSCWPGLRAFVYGEGTPQQKFKYYTKIVKEPNVNEVEDF